jgi:hypothetical protein
MDIRNLLDEMYIKMPEARSHIFAALSNVRHDYLLKPTSKATSCKQNEPVKRSRKQC